MANQEYAEISRMALERISDAWSIENRQADEENSEIFYLGSTRKGNIIRDYYIDSQGQYWYRNRAVVDGRIVSMEVYIFGKEARELQRTRYQRHERRTKKELIH